MYRISKAADSTLPKCHTMCSNKESSATECFQCMCVRNCLRVRAREILCYFLCFLFVVFFLHWTGCVCASVCVCVCLYVLHVFCRFTLFSLSLPLVYGILFISIEEDAFSHSLVLFKIIDHTAASRPTACLAVCLHECDEPQRKYNHFKACFLLFIRKPKYIWQMELQPSKEREKK